MRDFTLRAPDEATMMAALKAADMTYRGDDGTDRPRAAGNGWALDVVGDYPGGYWANLRYEDENAILPAVLVPYVVETPPPPYRRWA